MDRLMATRALRGQVRDDEIISVASSPATLVHAGHAASVHSGSTNWKAASEGHKAASDDVAQYLVADSPPDSLTNVPQGATSDSENEVDEEPVKCRHGEPAARKYCWEGADTGRYFYCCRRKEKPCNFIQWIDGEWPKPVQTALQTMWGVIGDYEKMTNQAVQEKLAALAALRASEVRASRAFGMAVFTGGMMMAMLAAWWQQIAN